MSSTTINLPFSQQEIQLISQTLQKTTNNDLNSWLTNALTKTFSEQFTNFTNPFVINWKAARPTIKYFENRNNWQNPQSTQLEIQFSGLDQTTLNHVVEILDNHGLNFWNVNRLSAFLLAQLLAGSDEQFSIPITDDYQVSFTRAHNEIMQHFMNQDL